MSFHPLESDVPPLNVSSAPDAGKPKSVRNSQQAQKSFSGLPALRPRAALASSKICQRRRSILTIIASLPPPYS